MKDSSRRTSLEDNPSGVDSKVESNNDDVDTPDSYEKTITSSGKEVKEEMEASKSKESQVDSNKRSEKMIAEDDARSRVEASTEAQLAAIDEDIEKATLDAKERLSDCSSDGEWKNKDPSWEDLGLVDDEVLNDFHNKVSLLLFTFGHYELANDIYEHPQAYQFLLRIRLEPIKIRRLSFSFRLYVYEQMS
jgi:hypothetical protein